MIPRKGVGTAGTSDRKRVVERYIEGFRAGGRIDALFCDVFHFRHDEICRLVTYQVDSHPGDRTRRAFEA